MAGPALDDMHVTAELSGLTPRVVSVGIVNETALKRAAHAKERYTRENRDFQRIDKMNEDAGRTRHQNNLSPRLGSQKATPRRRRVGDS